MSIKSKIKTFSGERWNIGFIRNDIDSILRGDEIKIDYLTHKYHKYSWFADPFILDVTDNEIICLVEEFYKPIKRGRISKLTIDKISFELRGLDVVLELPTHLSFPVIIRKDDEIFIMPENGASGYLYVYKYEPTTNRLERIESVLDGNVGDAIPLTVNGQLFLFATNGKDPNGKILSIFKWYEEFRIFIQDQTVQFDEKVARMSGDFFTHNGKLYRPTQECNVQYGHAVTIQEVTHHENEWNFKEIRRMYSVNPKLNVGMHTFNMYKGVIVTDCLGFDNMWFRNILKRIGILH